MKEYQLSDQELVKKFLDGNQRSFEELLSRHKERVHTYIYLIVKDHQLAEDIFQETFIKVINSLRKGKYQDNGKFISWVIRISHNLVIDHFRKQKQLNTVNNDDYEQDILNTVKLSGGTVEDALINKQVKGDLRKVIKELPHEQKEVILLRHFVGLSFKEISQITDVSINTALGRMRYALINLRKLITEKDLSIAP